MNLQKIRSLIDEIDGEILGLLNERHGARPADGEAQGCRARRGTGEAGPGRGGPAVPGL